LGTQNVSIAARISFKSNIVLERKGDECCVENKMSKVSEDFW